jgi:2-oxoglutarate dehydrogenase E1 component
LLRHPQCVSSISDLSDGKFEGIIDDKINIKKAEKLVLCSGKIYYELLDRREEEKTEKVVLVRLEQIFPLDIEGIKGLIKKYNAKEIIWAQEEPENMGAWTFILSQLRDLSINVISRSASAATASGSSKRSAAQQNEIIDKVFK